MYDSQGGTRVHYLHGYLLFFHFGDYGHKAFVTKVRLVNARNILSIYGVSVSQVNAITGRRNQYLKKTSDHMVPE